MKNTLVLLSMAFASMAMVASSAPGDIVEWIVNGDFETGDFTGWTNASASTINSTTPITGDYSADVAIGAGGDTGLRQEGFGIVSNATVSFDFIMEDPGGAADRGLQMYLNTFGVNMRVVDGTTLDDGFGDVEFYTSTGGGWLPVLANAVVFGTSNSVIITINAYGDDLDYDLTVNGITTNGLSYLHDSGTFDALNALAFLGQSSTVGFTVDNVSVVAAESPPPPLSVFEVINGDFETGDLSGWVASGSEVVVSGLAGSTFAADLNGGEMWQDCFLPGGGDLEGLTNGWTFTAVITLDDLGGAQRIRLRGGNDNVTTDMITMKMDSAGLYEYSGVWEVAVALPLAINTEYHVRAVVSETNDSVVYGLSTNGVDWTESAVYTETHGLLSLGFETITVSGNMVVDEIVVVNMDIGPPPPATPVTLSISVSAAETEIFWVATNRLLYAVETNSNLIINNGWNTLTSNIPGVNGVIAVTNAIGADQLFYRVKTTQGE